MPTRAVRRKGSRSRREAERETRRRFILEAARGLLERRGIEGTTMDDIARAAGYTRRTLYQYFKSRDDVLMSAQLDGVEQRWEMQQEALDGIAGAPERLVVWAETLHAFWKEHPFTMRMELYWDYHGIRRKRLSARVFRRFEELNEELADGLREIYRDGIEEGSLRAELDVDVCISQFLYSLRAVLSRALSSSYSFSRIKPDRYVRHFLEQYCRGILATNA